MKGLEIRLGPNGPALEPRTVGIMTQNVLGGKPARAKRPRESSAP